MQSYIATGRLCNNPKFTENNGKKRATFFLAVSRRHRKEGMPEADFISCTAYGARAQFAYDYFKKGMRAEIKGEIQTYTYTENETTYHGFTVFLDFLDFGDSKSANAQYQGNITEPSNEHDSPPVEEPEGYEDGFPGVDAMVECPACHEMVPKADQCIECGARLR